MEKITRIFLAVVIVLIVSFVVNPNPVVMAGGGGGDSGGIGGGYSSGITLQQREQIEQQLWNRVYEILISAWNQDYAYFTSCAPGGSGCSSEINNPKPGAYNVWVDARVYDYDVMVDIFPFNGNAQTVIRVGENFAAVKLTLREWQFVKIALPTAVSTDDTVRLRFQNDGYENEINVGITDDGRIVWAHVPLGGTNFSLVVNDKTFQIQNDNVFTAIANSEPISLVNLYVSVERLERYVRVPSEFSSIQAAINFVPGGSTIVIEPGVYEERIMIDLPDQGEITLLGSPSSPRDVVIRSSAPQTLWVEGGTAKINLIGLTIQNDFLGRPNGEKWYSDAAVTFDLGVIGTIDHVVIESTGSGNVIVANYSTLKMTNVTLAGNYSNNGIVMYNNTTDATPDERWRNVFDYLIFYSLNQATDIQHGWARVNNSVYFLVKDTSDTNPYVSTNVWGNPDFLGYYDWNRYLPSYDSVVIKEAIKKGNGNYPGALMPVRPSFGGKG